MEAAVSGNLPILMVGVVIANSVFKKTRTLQRKLYSSLLESTERRMEAGKGNGAFMEILLDKKDQWGLDRTMVQ